MRVFISSVRRGLEEERDAIPGLIVALGHVATRFEDFTAMGVPTRQACVSGVQEADAYLLLLGERYGEPLPDTGLTPTEEEYRVAKRRGIPILAFRKHGSTPEPAQAAFLARVEDYATGVFREAFDGTADLLAKVAAALRRLDEAPPSLAYTPLDGTVETPWDVVPRLSAGGTSTTVELHAIPLDRQHHAATTTASWPERLTRTGRAHRLFPDERAIDSGLERTGAYAVMHPQPRADTAGVRLGSTGVASVWMQLPSDMLGVILDQADLAARLASMLRLAADLLPTSGDVALAVGLRGLTMVTEGSVSDLGRRNSSQMSGFLSQDGSASVEARDSVPVGTLPRAAEEVAGELAMRLVLRFREVVR